MTTILAQPIIFSAPMVRALLDGRKTQTRRVIPQQDLVEFDEQDGLAIYAHAKNCPNFCEYACNGPMPGGPWRIGECLWVRETWRSEERESDCTDGVRYAANDSFVPIQNTVAAADKWIIVYDNNRHGSNWRSPIHMPRWASRLMIEISGVHVEKLQEISKQDAIAEGLDFSIPTSGAQWAFRELWNQLHYKKDAWDENPWVWVLEFKVLP